MWYEPLPGYCGNKSSENQKQMQHKTFFFSKYKYMADKGSQSDKITFKDMTEDM